MPAPTLHTPANPVIEVDLNGNPIDSPATTSGRYVQGNVASGVVDAGNPVKLGGYASATAPAAVADGQRVNAWFNRNGSMTVSLVDSGGVIMPSRFPASDGGAAAQGLITWSQNTVFNGSTWDRARGDITGAWTHAPANTVSTALSGTIATSGTTTTVAFINTARQEIINPSTATIWASWGTPSVNGAGSFPINASGSFSTDRTSGTLTLLSTIATQAFTVNRYS